MAGCTARHAQPLGQTCSVLLSASVPPVFTARIALVELFAAQPTARAFAVVPIAGATHSLIGVLSLGSAHDFTFLTLPVSPVSGLPWRALMRHTS